MLSTKTLHWIHKWTGLISGINVLVLSVTGAYLVFHEELNAMAAPSEGAVVLEVDPSSPTPMQDGMDGLAAAAGDGARPMRIRAVPNEPAKVELAVFAGGAQLRYVLDRESGVVRTHQDGAMVRLNEFIFKLHATLFLGIMGSFVLGAVALLFLTSTVTGCIIYAPFMKQMVFGAFRRGKGWRKASADLHKIVGASSLAFNLLMAITGIALTLGLVGVQMWSLKTVQARAAAGEVADASSVAPPPIDAVLAASEALHPGAPMNNVAYPGGYQGKNYYLAFHDSPGALSRYIPKLSLVPVADPSGASVLEMPWWVQGVMVCFPLHFGNFAGLGLKIVYSVFGVTSGLLSVSGAVIAFAGWRGRFRARRKARMREGAGPSDGPLRPRESEG